ncbi:MAG: SDR family oxidoreductase [Deltaproteobacteria bacterium]|nr:SDR family oxidoreductase [Deltaproteobacteria bacterium]
MLFSNSKKILVTGGAGFIGSHLCRALLTEGHYVICVDNLFTGSRTNIKTLLDLDNFEFLRHDIVEPLLIDVDEIYNLACPASPVHYQHNPVKTIQTNVVGTYNMLELARHGKSRILQASTSEVYGDPDVHPQNEDYRGNVNTVGPRSCYDEGKRCAETLLSDYHLQNNVDIRIARIFNTYGPRMAENDGRVVSNFCLQALKNEPITIFGDGAQTRSFCFVDDTVRGLIALMNYTGDDAHDPVNIGNPGEMSMLELAELIIDFCKSKSKITTHPLPQDDPKRRCPDITRAKSILNWEPKTKVTDGMELTIEFFKARLTQRHVMP